MAHSRSLHRSIDQDLVERIYAYGPQKGSGKTAGKLVRKSKGKARDASTYRGARRNTRFGRLPQGRNRAELFGLSRDVFTGHPAKIEDQQLGLRAVEEAFGGNNG